MLAATLPESSPYPHLFHLALELISANRQLPDPLARHFEDVARQAMGLLDNPKTVDRYTLPEAVELAVQLQKSERLRSALFAGGKSISADQARSLLALEQYAAA